MPAPFSPLPYRLAARELTCLVVAALAGTTALAAPPQPPPYSALRDVRVVVGDGRVLEKATVLVADGLIEAVGPASEMAIPGDAWVLEGDGLTVFPGLIDGLTTLGLATADEPDGRGSGGPPGNAPEIRGPEDRPATAPWESAADQLGEDGRIEKWRRAGFTSAVTAPENGIFAGQAALINLGSGEPRTQVVAAPVAQRVNFASDGGFRSYPGSLMGVLSYIRQVLADTEHYREVEKLYAADPRGRERPTYDRALAPLAAAMAAQQPFLMPGQLGREIDRALAIGAAHGLQTIVYGAQGGYQRARELARAGARVVVDLDWPEAEKDRDPDADTPLRTLAHRRLAPTSPQELAAAGVAFAFSSEGLSGPSEIFEKIRTAIDAGLSPEAATRALTSHAAEIFGVADRLGTVEPGKIANLVLATAEPWAEAAEVVAVFVDGRRYEKPAEDDEDLEPPAADVSGTWALTLDSPRGSRELTAELEMAEDGKVKGELTSERGSRDVEDGRMSGDLLRFKTTQTRGGRTMEASYSLTLSGERLDGTMSAGSMTMELSGERTAMPDAGADDDDSADGEPEVTLAELRGAMARAHGPARRMDRFAIVNATVWTVAGETLENATVAVADGRITAVGADVAMPEGIEIIDAAGGALIPGIIDAHSHIAVDGGVNEGTLTVTSMVRIADVLDPDDIGIYRALAGGVTTANILHGSANPIGGQNAVIKLRWGQDADGLLFAGAPPGIKFALGENPKRSNFRVPGASRYPATRMGVMDVIRQAFTDARAYRQDWQEYEQTGKRGKRPLPPRRDFELEALVEILEGTRLVHSHCYRADEILQLLRLAEETGFRIATLQHVLEGYKVADEIAAAGAGASTFSDWWGYKVEAYDAIPHNAALMTERGVLVSINSDSGEEMRHLNQEAAKAVKWGGLDEIEALKLVTLNPAIQLGIADRVGSIEPGKDADLVLYDGHPLAMSSVVQKTFVDGDLYFDLGADRERQAAIDEIKQRLAPKKDDGPLSTDEPEPEQPEEPEGEPPPSLAWSEHGAYSCREEIR